MPHPISKSIICVCEAEEAHQFTTTAPPLPPSPPHGSVSSGCNRALQSPHPSPPVSPRLAYCTQPASSIQHPAPADRMWMRGFQWGGGDGDGGPACPRSSAFHPRRRHKRQEAAGGSPSSAPASASAPSPALYLPSPSPKQFMSRSRSLLRLPLCPSFLVKWVQRRNGGGGWKKLDSWWVLCPLKQKITCNHLSTPHFP